MNTDNKFIGFGLKETPKDDRDFQLGAIINLPALEELPQEFYFKLTKVKDQLDTDFCSAYATCAISEIQEEVELDPLWSFAVSKMLSGDADEWGQDIRSALKGHTKYGAIEISNSPYSIIDADIARHINKWPEDLFDNAKKHQKKTFFKVSGPYDHYDNIRASIWHFRAKKQGIVLGIKWQWASTDVILKGMGDFGFGHMIAGIGWDHRGIKLQNSAGETAGENGFHYMPREEINHFVENYGAYMLVDMDREDAEHMIYHGIQTSDNWITGLIKTIKKIISELCIK